MVVGYARVSTIEQSHDLQIDALAKAGVERVFIEKKSGASFENRPEFLKCFNFLQKGDTLIVWKLDRLGRSLRHLIGVMDDLKSRGVHFKSLTETIDTATPAGRMMFQIMGAFAEFERNIIRERSMEGLIAARARGRIGGRRAVIRDDMVPQIIEMRKTMTVLEVAFQLKVGESTVWRTLKEYRKRQAKAGNYEPMNGLAN